MSTYKQPLSTINPVKIKLSIVIFHVFLLSFSDNKISYIDEYNRFKEISFKEVILTQDNDTASLSMAIDIPARYKTANSIITFQPVLLTDTIAYKFNPKFIQGTGVTANNETVSYNNRTRILYYDEMKCDIDLASAKLKLVVEFFQYKKEDKRLKIDTVLNYT